MKFGTGFLKLLTLCFLTAACSPHERPEVSWEQLTHDLYAPESIADLSASCTEIYTSYDRTGGNNDYNNGFENLGNGWLELVDLKGPGVMTRFWFTGIWKARIRFVFDNETTHRLETTWDDLYAGKSGFPKTYMSMDQNCFYSGFPIPYQKRLRILVSDEGYSRGKGKLFFQVNATPLKNKTVFSAQFPVSEEVVCAAKAVAESLKVLSRPSVPVHKAEFEIQSNKSQAVATFDSAGTIQRLRIELDGWDGMTFHQRRALLRQVWLRMSWDGLDEDSVRVPLGDFFGQMWEPKKLSNLYVSVDETGFECRFPMPFRKSAKITLDNHGKNTVSGQITVVKNSSPVPENNGYFHCGWHRSSKSFQGYPHDVLKVKGRGRLAGCLLGVASMDRSFWVLESDETILRDSSKQVFWQGTGLEDYFNGGWYYRTVFQNPLYGLTMKRPFRTVQYRFHLQDPVTFNKKLDMSFERGPGNQSRAAYDSTVYYYLEKPSAVSGQKFRAGHLNPPADEFEARSLMTRLWDYEKLDDFSNAEKLTQHAVKYWKYPAGIKSILSRRVQAYQARSSGVAPEGAALLFLYSNKKSSVFLDGKQVLITSDPTRAQVASLPLTAGRHVLAIETEAGAWPDWVQAGLKTDDGVIGIDSSWKCRLNPIGNWRDLLYNDEGWNQPFGVCKGPPEQEAVPFVYPDPYVGLQSQVEGVRAHRLPKGKRGKVVFRKVFEIE